MSLKTSPFKFFDRYNVDLHISKEKRYFTEFIILKKTRRCFETQIYMFYMPSCLYLCSTFTTIRRFPSCNAGMIETRNSKVDCFICYRALSPIPQRRAAPLMTNCAQRPHQRRFNIFTSIYVRVMFLSPAKYPLFDLSVFLSLFLTFF